MPVLQEIEILDSERVNIARGDCWMVYVYSDNCPRRKFRKLEQALNFSAGRYPLYQWRPHSDGSPLHWCWRLCD